MWRTSLSGDEPPDERIPRALDAWARYIEVHPYVPRMFFVETTGDPEVEEIHRQVREQVGRRAGGDPGAGAGGRGHRRVRRPAVARWRPR